MWGSAGTLREHLREVNVGRAASPQFVLLLEVNNKCELASPCF